jgi:hypothetical protein
MFDPEPRLDPPEDFYIMADCGSEVYTGEMLAYWRDDSGRIISVDVDYLNDRWDELTPQEKADLFGCDYEIVGEEYD